MANVLQPHHLDQFSARLEGTRYSLATGKLPQLDSDEARARLFGLDREDLADRVMAGFSKAVIAGVGSIFLASAVRLVWVFAL